MLQPTPTTLAAALEFGKNAKIAFAFFVLGNRGLYTSNLSEKLTLEQPVDWSPGYYIYGSPTWSPDGHSLAFEFYNGRGTRIYVANLDGTNLRPLTNELIAALTNPNWSPDNSYIAFTTRTELYIIKPNGAGLKKLASLGTLTHPTWSPDGKWIAFLADQETYYPEAKLYIIDKDGKNLRPLTGPIANNYSRISWSPDGQRLVFGSMTADGCRDLSILELPTGVVTPFITSPSFEKDPVWSADGKYIVFSATNKDTCKEFTAESPYGPYQLFVADVNSQTISSAISPEGAIEPALWPLVSIHLGWTYQVTELGKNLNVREQPSLSSQKLDSLMGTETFTVLDGPVNADAYQWWKIKTKNEIIGWLVDMPGWYILDTAPTPNP
jgi:Tol biopolymer transport system component